MKTVVERIGEQHDNLYFQEHLKRYLFAIPYFQPGWTLDIACGSGYGVSLLGQDTSQHIIGIDVDRPTLCKAQQTYAEGLNFLAADGVRLPFSVGMFHNIVTLETIEHITDDRRFLAELSRVLDHNGVCVLSTPNREHSLRHRRKNPYHVREYVADELLELLSGFFGMVELFYQGFSASYYGTVAHYAEAIQQEKAHLPYPVRLVIDRVYRPLKHMIPARITNLSVRSLLKQQYPQPTAEEIQIASEPLEDYSVLIAVCRQPIGTTGRLA